MHEELPKTAFVALDDSWHRLVNWPEDGGLTSTWCGLKTKAISAATESFIRRMCPNQICEKCEQQFEAGEGPRG